MRRRLDCGEIIPWLIKTAEDASCEFFDDMPPVTFSCGKEKDCLGIEARYYRTARKIEFSPGFIASCWKGKHRFWNLGRLRITLLHELIHAWVDWKGHWSESAGSHNEWFLYKAWKLGLDMRATRVRWPEIIPLDNDIRLGWNPDVMPLDDWRALMVAAKGWEWEDWDSLVSRCRLIAAMEKKVSAHDWRGVVAALERSSPSISDCKVILEIEERARLYERNGIRGVQDFRSMLRYEFAEDFQSGHAHQWHEITRRCHEVVQIIEPWENATVSQIGDEFRCKRSTLYECAEAIKCCRPLREFFARLRTAFDHEIASADRFKSEVESICSDEEEIALYSELNHLCFEKPNTDIYEFFRLIFVF